MSCALSPRRRSHQSPIRQIETAASSQPVALAARSGQTMAVHRQGAPVMLRSPSFVARWRRTSVIRFRRAEPDHESSPSQPAGDLSQFTGGSGRWNARVRSRGRFRCDRPAALTPGCCLPDAATVSLDAPIQGPVPDSHWLLQRRVDSAVWRSRRERWLSSVSQPGPGFALVVLGGARRRRGELGETSPVASGGRLASGRNVGAAVDQICP